MKNLYLGEERSLLRKLREAPLALLLELRHSKDEILEAYLNEIYLGQNGALAIHGVERAAQFYFGKGVEELTLPEAALLAGLIPAPNRYSPLRHPERAKQRRDLVLRLMAEQGRVSEAASAAAEASGLGLREERRAAGPGAHFVSLVEQRLEARLGATRLQEQGLSVFTTLDAGFQRAAEAAVAKGLADLERRHPELRRGKARPEAALVALDPLTGDVLAWVGGRDHARSPFDRALAAKRQPGSLMKPIVAASALLARGERPRADARERAGGRAARGRRGGGPVAAGELRWPPPRAGERPPGARAVAERADRAPRSRGRARARGRDGARASGSRARSARCPPSRSARSR